LPLALTLTPMAEDTPASPAAKTEPAGVFAPKPPAHAQRELNTASGLARDLVDVIVYLEQGQAYFRSYQSGTHTAEDNARFLAFLEAYEKESAIAKKESETLRKWVLEKTELE
jgi:hypothetical protein